MGYGGGTGDGHQWAAPREIDVLSPEGERDISPPCGRVPVKDVGLCL